MAKAKYRVCDNYSSYSAWSWTLISSNGREIARSAQRYNSKSACLRAIEAVRKHARTTRFEEEC